MTVASTGFPPVVAFTFNVKVPTQGACAGLITSGVVAVLLDVALIVAVVWPLTGVVVTGKVPLL